MFGLDCRKAGEPVGVRGCLNKVSVEIGSAIGPPDRPPLPQSYLCCVHSSPGILSPLGITLPHRLLLRAPRRHEFSDKVGALRLTYVRV